MNAIVVFFISAVLSGGAQAAPLNFDEALAKIISRSTSVQTQQANLNLTEANALPSKFIFAPSLSFDAKTYRGGNSAYTGGLDSQIEATSKYNLFHWGADFANLSAASADIDMQVLALESSRLSVEDQAITALVAQVQALQEIKINQEIVDIQTNLYKIAHERFKSGYLAVQEVNKISVDLENAIASLSNVQLEEASTRSQLENLLGSSDVELEWPWKMRMKQSETKIENEKWDANALPDWQAAHRHLEAEEARLHKTQRLLLPSLDANFSYGLYKGLDTIGASPTWTPGWTAALGITFPFFDNLITYSNMKAQIYNEKIADIALTQKERDVKAAWDSSRVSFQISLKAANGREKTLDTSRQLYQDSLKRFQAGRISANDLVIDQRRLLDSELFAVQGWAYAHLQFPKLCHSLGKRLEDCW